MYRAVSTEARGWYEALRERYVWSRLLSLALCAALCSAGGAVGAGTIGAPAAVLGTTLVFSGALLARLRLTGRV
jgi:hypothetical protein